MNFVFSMSGTESCVAVKDASTMAIYVCFFYMVHIMRIIILTIFCG